MEHETNLRALRHRHGVCLTELADACGLSNQYLSRAELGQIAATPRLEIQLAEAVEKAILRRAAVIRDMNRDFRRCRGHLLEVSGGE